MNKNSKSAVITAGTGTVIMLITAATAGPDSLSKVLALAMAMVVFTIAITVVALIMRSNPESRPYSKGVWVGGGIALLIGFSICTAGAI